MIMMVMMIVVVWCGLVSLSLWSGLVRSGPLSLSLFLFLSLSGLVWSGLAWPGRVWSDLSLSLWSGLVWSGRVPLSLSGLVWSGLVWSGLPRSGLVWPGLSVSLSLCLLRSVYMVDYGLSLSLWCGVVWCGVVWCGV